MMSESDLDPHAMVGAYVADALDDIERATFERHLAACESCRREVTEFSETLGELSRLAETPPPPSLRAAILRDVATIRPLPPEQPAPPAVPPEAAAAATSGRPATGDEVTLRRRSRRALTGLAAALIVVVALGGWVGVLIHDQRQQQVASQQISELLTAPDATVYTAQLNGSPVSYVVSRERNTALFLGNDVAAPPSGRVYQLWMLRPGDIAEPNATVDRGGTVATWLTGSLDDAEGLAITVEPAGGSDQPTTSPVAVVRL